MDKKTITALKGSIEKWSKIVRSTRALDNGTANCLLCKIFFNANCIGCPVRGKTLKHCCYRTPYTKWRLHQEEMHCGVVGSHRNKDCKKCLPLAKAELNFLKSLLPK